MLLLLFLEAIPGRKGCLSFYISPPADPPPRAVPAAQQVPLSHPRQFCGSPRSLCGGVRGSGSVVLPWGCAAGCVALHRAGVLFPQPSLGTTLAATFSSPWAAEKPSRSGLSCRNHPEGPAVTPSLSPELPSLCSSCRTWESLQEEGRI